MKGTTKKQSLSPAVTRTGLEKKLLDRIMELEAKVESLNDKVETLEMKVESFEKSTVPALHKEITILKDRNAVACTVSQKLSDEVERQQQYSRRNCLVLEGIPLNRRETNESLMKQVKDSIEELGIEENEFKSTIDKTHRIGPIRDNAQRVIVRFNKHSTCEKIYENRKRSKKIQIKPSLTKKRLKTLNSAKERFQKCEHINFIFTDIHGNLKVRFNKQVGGRYVHSFEKEEDLSELVFDADNQLPCDYFQNFENNE